MIGIKFCIPNWIQLWFRWLLSAIFAHDISRSLEPNATVDQMELSANVVFTDRKLTSGNGDPTSVESSFISLLQNILSLYFKMPLISLYGHIPFYSSRIHPKFSYIQAPIGLKKENLFQFARDNLRFKDMINIFKLPSKSFLNYFPKKPILHANNSTNNA